MANTLDEIAHGIVTVLSHSPVPEPLVAELKGHTQAEAIYLAQAVADECAAAGVRLAKVELGSREQFVPFEIAAPTTDWGNVELVIDQRVGSAVQFWRWPK